MVFVFDCVIGWAARNSNYQLNTRWIKRSCAVMWIKSIRTSIQRNAWCKRHEICMNTGLKKINLSKTEIIGVNVDKNFQFQIKYILLLFFH